MVFRSINERYNAALKAFNNGDLESAGILLTEIKDETEDLNSSYFLAVVKSQLGNYSEAIELYRQVIDKMPDHPEAYFNIALCYQKLEEEDSALEYYLKAVEVNPNLDDAYNNIAYIYQNRGNNELAEKYLLMTNEDYFYAGAKESGLSDLETTQLIPEIAEANKYIKLGNLEKAKSILENSFHLYSNNKEFLSALGNVSFHSENYQDALKYFHKALDLDKNDPVLYYSCAVVMQKVNQKDNAFAYYKKSVELKPDYPDALNNIALIYFAKKDYEKAEVYFNRALQANPKHLNSLVNLGSTKTFLNDYQAASAAFDLAIDIADKNNDTENKAVIYTNIGFLELRKNNLEKALEYFDKSLELKPDYVIANYNKGETLLKLGDFRQGWLFYEYRLQREEFGPRKFYKPLTSLENIAGKKVLIYAEQGLGDAFHFLRYLKLLKREGAYIIFECDKGLHPLLTNCDYIDELIERISSPKRDIQYDYDVPLLSLAKLYNTNLENIPLEIPYIKADEETVEFWKEHIDSEGLKVGLVWGGSPNHQNDINRSVKLSQLSFLFDLKDVSYYSLQKGIPQMQLSDYALMVKDLDSVGIKSWADTAAIIENLDLVITVDTSVCHLAGAMGKETWVLIPYNSDWRWLRNREDSPWYPTMKLYRQKSLGNWEEVFEKLGNDLKEKLTPNSSSEIPKNTFTNKEPNTIEVIDEYKLEIPQELSDEISTAMFKNIIESIETKDSPSVAIIGGFEANNLPAMRQFSNKIDVYSTTANEKEHYRTVHEESTQIALDTFKPVKEYDLVWSRYFLNRSKTPFETIKQVQKFLRKGGFAYFEAPAENTAANHENTAGNYAVFGQKMWNALFEKAGFELIASGSLDIDFEDDGNDINYYFLLKNVAAVTEDRIKKTPSLILSLPKGENFGWGVCSKYIRKELKNNVDYFDADKGISGKVNGKVFHALQNQSFQTLNDIWGDENYGYTFFEFELNEKSVENAAKFNKVIAGSTWCEEKMHEKGIYNTATLIQGIDHERFYPGEKERNHELFVIFSGGKFELRKGQDLVLKAFQILHKKYPDIILVNAWYNLWEETMSTMKISPYINFEMEGNTWKNRMIKLLQENDIDGDRVFTLPIVPNEKLRDVYLSTDIGLFPNRCEGGTNLVLMEYMACGKPVVASYNSGHKDILTDENSLKLADMKEFKISDDNGSLMAKWEEPSIEEIIAQIEWAYHNRDALKKIGSKAAEDMKNFTWKHTAENLIKLVY